MLMSVVFMHFYFRYHIRIILEAFHVCTSGMLFY